VIDPAELTGVFSAPGWLRDAGFTSWLLVGVTVLLVGMVWLGSLTSTIVLPLIAAGVIAVVAGQLVSLMQRHRVPRGLGALAVLLLIVAAGALTTYLILAGIGSEASDSYKGLVEGVAKGIAALSLIIFFLAMTTLSLFFLLKDGPQRSAPGWSGTWVSPPTWRRRSPVARCNRCGAISSG
jgi:predicted PurR-regulated permease PerM